MAGSGGDARLAACIDIVQAGRFGGEANRDAQINAAQLADRPGKFPIIIYFYLMFFGRAEELGAGGAQLHRLSHVRVA